MFNRSIKGKYDFLAIFLIIVLGVLVFGMFSKKTVPNEDFDSYFSIAQDFYEKYDGNAFEKAIFSLDNLEVEMSGSSIIVKNSEGLGVQTNKDDVGNVLCIHYSDNSLATGMTMLTMLTSSFLYVSIIIIKELIREKKKYLEY